MEMISFWESNSSMEISQEEMVSWLPSMKPGISITLNDQMSTAQEVGSSSGC